MSILDRRFEPTPSLPLTPDAAASASLADLMRRVTDDPALTPIQRRDLLSALRAFARGVGQPADAITTDVASLRRLIGRAQPATAGLSPARWRNVRSGIANVVRRYQGGKARQWQATQLTGRWRELRDGITNDAIRIGLSRLFRFLAQEEIPPEAVDASIFVQFRSWLAEQTLCADPDGVQRRSLQQWNQAAAAGMPWPSVELDLPSRRKTFLLPLDTFPISFAADLAAWQSVVGGEDVLDERAPARPLRPRTVAHEALVLRRFASALEHQGVPPTAIAGLADLVQPERFKLALRFFLDRRGGKPTRGLGPMAGIVVAVARHWVQIDQATLAALRQLAKRMQTGTPGLTADNRRRLGQFDDRRNVRQLLGLPGRLVQLAQVRGAERQAALLVQAALAVSILLAAPLRLRNLAGLDLRRHLIRTGMGSSRGMRIAIERHETKNHAVLDYPLPEATVRLLDLYLERYRPLLEPSGSWLFPGRDGKAKNANLLSQQIQAAIRRHTGLVVHTHLFRHLAGKLSLLLDPGNYEQVRRLLGHQSIDTTTIYYTGFATDAAARRYHEQVLQLGERAAPKRCRRAR